MRKKLRRSVANYTISHKKHRTEICVNTQSLETIAKCVFAIRKIGLVSNTFCSYYKYTLSVRLDDYSFGLYNPNSNHYVHIPFISKFQTFLDFSAPYILELPIIDFHSLIIT